MIQTLEDYTLRLPSNLSPDQFSEFLAQQDAIEHDITRDSDDLPSELDSIDFESDDDDTFYGIEMCDDSPIDGDNSDCPFNSVFELYPYDDIFFKFTTCYVVKPHILVEPNLFQNQCHLSVLFVRKSINSFFIPLPPRFLCKIFPHGLKKHELRSRFAQFNSDHFRTVCMSTLCHINSKLLSLSDTLIILTLNSLIFRGSTFTISQLYAHYSLGDPVYCDVSGLGLCKLPPIVAVSDAPNLDFIPSSLNYIKLPLLTQFFVHFINCYI